jgi:hypothetical protein
MFHLFQWTVYNLQDKENTHTMRQQRVLRLPYKY